MENRLVISLSEPNYSKDLEHLVEFFEGFSSKLYQCTAGRWTIGFGYNIEARGLPRVLCEMLLRHDLHALTEWARTTFPWWDEIGTVRQNALILMAYQLGRDGLLGFRGMLNAIAARDWERAHKEALDSKWARHDTPGRAWRTAAALRDNDRSRFFVSA